MSILATIEGGTPVPVEGPVAIKDGTVYMSLPPALQEVMATHPDKPITLSHQPGGFSVVLFEADNPSYKEDITLQPPISVAPYEDLPR